mgnify:CR=1 FL=1
MGKPRIGESLEDFRKRNREYARKYRKNNDKYGMRSHAAIVLNTRLVEVDPHPAGRIDD